MPNRIRRSRVLPVGGQRRQTFWLATQSAAVFTNLGGSTKAITHSFTGAQVSALAPFTIVRTVGLLYIRTPVATAADEVQLGGLGHMIVTELARAAGIASIPSPVTDASDDMWYQFLYFGNSFRFVSAIGEQSSDGRVFMFDSKAQRKVEDGMAIVSVMENIGGNALEFWVNYRTLIKTH